MYVVRPSKYQAVFTKYDKVLFTTTLGQDITTKEKDIYGIHYNLKKRGENTRETVILIDPKKMAMPWLKKTYLIRKYSKCRFSLQIHIQCKP